MDIKRIIKKLEKNVAIAVMWLDARTYSEWLSEREISELKLPEIKSLGWYGGIVNRALVIKHNYCISDNEADCTIIPIGWIQKIIQLKLKERS